MNLCPDILRQHPIVEGIHGLDGIDTVAVRLTLGGLTRHPGMTPIGDTLMFSADTICGLHHGSVGFQAWAEPGRSLYTRREQRLFTIDTYSRRGFDTQPRPGFHAGFTASPAARPATGLSGLDEA